MCVPASTFISETLSPATAAHDMRAEIETDGLWFCDPEQDGPAIHQFGAWAGQTPRSPCPPCAAAGCGWRWLARWFTLRLLSSPLISFSGTRRHRSTHVLHQLCPLLDCTPRPGRQSCLLDHVRDTQKCYRGLPHYISLSAASCNVEGNLYMVWKLGALVKKSQPNLLSRTLCTGSM